MRSLLIFYFLINTGLALKILVFSAPLGFSHMQFMAAIADTLFEAGHDVTVLHPVAHPEKLHAVSKKSKQLLIHLPKSHYRHHDAKEMGLWNLASDSVIDRMSIVMTFTESQLEMCEYLLRDNYTINLLRNEKFDVGISEIFALCGFGIFELANIPNLVGASAVGVVDTMNEFIDVPIMPSFMPSFLSSYGENMTFQQRFVNFFLHGAVSMASQLIRFRYERIFAKYGLYSGLREFVYARINYVLSNSDEFLDFSWPKSDKLVHIGGITLPKTATLEEKYRLIMERHDRRGVILISFGSSVPTVQMPHSMRTAILDAVSKFQNYTFIWKIDETDTVPEMPNLVTSSWLPQAALLGHPKLRCFVSHGGLNSVLELARNGKPSILVPLYGDQHRNAKLVESRGSAIVIYKEHLTSENLIKSLQTILEDDIYRQKAERLSSLMTRKPFDLKERLLSTVEFSALHGKIEELNSYSYKMGVVQYFSLDVLFVTLSMLVLLVPILIHVVRKLFRFMFVYKYKAH
uniref:glucuronosyltransferase n=1 Tax=Haemonchus contortus TaxID=6289 RepID=A0A7I4YXK4_HAECO